MRAVHLTAYGNPVDGIEFVEIPEPPEPGANQVLVGVEFSPVNPNDLSLARGTYAVRPALPSVIGNEGVGRILAWVRASRPSKLAIAWWCLSRASRGGSAC